MNCPLRIFLVTIFFLFAASNGVLSQMGSFRLDEKIPLDKGVKYGKLKNGFKYYLKPESNAESKIFLRLIVKVGEENEERNQAEMAHLLEHLALNGTKSFSNISSFLSNEGLVWGNDVNAATGAKVTDYRIHIPESKPELFFSCLKIMSEWSGGGINLGSIALNAEKGAVKQELARNDDESNQIYREYIAKITGVGNHNDRIQLDTRSMLANIDSSSLKKFYARWYIPNRISLVVSGDFNVDEVEQEVKRLFSTGPKTSDRHKAKEPYVVPLSLTGSSNLYFIKQEQLANVECKIVVKNGFRPVVKFGDLKDELLRTMLAKLIEFRCVQEDRLADSKNRVLVRYAHQMSGFGRPFSAIEVGFKSDSTQIDSVYTRLMSQMLRITKFGFSDAEVDEIKDQIKTRLGKSSKTGRRSTINNCVNDVLEMGEVQDNEIKELAMIGILRDLTAEDINKALSQWRFDRNCDVAFFASPRYLTSIGKIDVEKWRGLAEVSSNKQFKYIRPDVSLPIRRSFPPLIPKAQDDLLQANLPLVAVDSIKAINATTFKLANGIRFVLKSDFDGDDQVYIQAVKRARSFKGDRLDSVMAKYSPYLVLASGPGQYTPDEWRKYQEQEGVRITQEVNSAGVSISGLVHQDDMEKVIQVIRLFITSPKIDKVVFENWKRQQKEDVQRLKNLSNPMDRYLKEVSDNGDIFSAITNSNDKIDALDVDALLAKYKEVYENNGDYVLFVCGRFNVDTVSVLLNKYIGTMPSILRKNVTVWSNKDVLPRGISKRVIEGNELTSSKVDMFFLGDMASVSCSEQYMEIVKFTFSKLILDRLRLREGISYSPTVSYSKLKGTMNAYYLVVSFDCAKDRVDDGIGFVREEFDHLQDYKVLQTILGPAKNSVAILSETRFKQPYFWSRYLMDSHLRGVQLSQLGGCIEFLDGITIKSIHDSIMNFSSNPNIFIFKAKNNAPN